MILLAGVSSVSPAAGQHTLDKKKQSETNHLSYPPKYPTYPIYLKILHTLST